MLRDYRRVRLAWNVTREEFTKNIYQLNRKVYDVIKLMLKM